MTPEEEVTKRDKAYIEFLEYLILDLRRKIDYGAYTAVGYQGPKFGEDDFDMPVDGEQLQQHWNVACKLVSPDVVENWWEKMWDALLPRFRDDISPNG